LRAVEHQREERRERLRRLRGFFERALDGSETALDSWPAYVGDEAEEPDDERPPIPDLLGSARDRAEAGLRKVRETAEPLEALLREDRFGEGDELLNRLAAGQENFGGEASVFAPLVATHERIEPLESWANFRRELEGLVRDLEDLLGSPRVRTKAANRARFPDPVGDPRGRPPTEAGTSPSPDHGPYGGEGAQSPHAGPPSPNGGGLWTSPRLGSGMIREKLAPWGLWGVLAVILGGLLVLTVLSPLALAASVLLLVASVVALIIRVAQGRPVKNWGIVAVASVVLMFTFGGISVALYGGGESDTAGGGGGGGGYDSANPGGSEVGDEVGDDVGDEVGVEVGDEVSFVAQPWERAGARRPGRA
jgi:hypothetical protein